MYDELHPHKLLSKSFAVFNCTQSSFAIDKRSLKEIENDNSIIVALTELFKKSKLIKLFFEGKNLIDTKL